eukprot:11022828-Karenia_brevis.AAC.1
MAALKLITSNGCAEADHIKPLQDSHQDGAESQAILVVPRPPYMSVFVAFVYVCIASTAFQNMLDS